MKFFTVLFFAASLFLFDAAALDKHEMVNDWQKTFGGTKKDQAFAISATSDGGAVAAGECQSFGEGRTDVCVLKMNSKGDVIWRTFFGGKKKDGARSVVQSSDGNIVVAGFSKSYSENGDSDVYVIKLNPDGKLIWEKTFGGAEEDEANSVDAIGNGGVIVAGFTDSYGKGNKDVYFLKLDANGKILLETAIGAQGDDYANGIVRTSDGNYVIAGGTESFGDNGFDFYYIKLSPKGQMFWEKTYGGENDDIVQGIVACDNGDFAMAGMTKSYGSKHKDLTIIKMNKDGNSYWHKIFGFKSKEYATSLARADNGGFVVAGTTKSFGMGEFDFYLLRLNDKGSLMWANVYGEADRDIAHGVTRIKNGEFIIVGQTDSYGKGSDDFFMMNLRDK